MNLGEALDARERSKRYVSFDPSSVDGIIEAAAQAVAEGVDHFMPSDYEAARAVFWAHADLPRSVSAKQWEAIDRAIRFAADAALGESRLVVWEDTE